MTDGYRRRGVEEEFEEEEIWSVMMEGKDSSSPNTKAKEEGKGPSSISSTPRRHSSTASRMIPKSNGHAQGRGCFQRSDPVNISDWSLSYHNDDDQSSQIHGCHNGGGDDDDGGGDDDDGDDDDGMIPPHEWIAKKLARSQISSFSMFEGRGRTLKGRDLSKVRNAVLTRTGFIE